MLNIRQIKHLANLVSFTPRRLVEIAESADRFCEKLILLDPAKPDKRRPVLDVRGDLRKVQDRLLHRLFMSKLSPSPFAHGGVRGRHIKTNIEAHLNSVFVFSADIADFFPTLSRNRIYRLFAKRLGCTPDVARILTHLCTYRHHLALGLVTSPFLAEQVLIPIDRRISGVCQSAGLTYTRYVDDVTISGGFDLNDKTSGFAASVARILNDHGFSMHKVVHGRLEEGTPITKIVVRNGHPDVRREYLAELNRQLDDARNLADGTEFTGPYFTKNQLVGRVQFVCWINPGRKYQLMKKLRRISWSNISSQAVSRGLVAAKKRLIRLDEVMR